MAIDPQVTDPAGTAGLKPGWKSLLLFTTRQHLPTLIVGALLALLAGCVTPILAIFLGNVFDVFTAFGDGQTGADQLRGKIATNCIGMVGLGAAGWILNGAYFAIFVAFGELQVSSVRSRTFSELLQRDVEWFEARKEGSGAFLSGIQAWVPILRIYRRGITSDILYRHIHDLQMATSQPLGLLLQYSCRSLASLGLGFYTSWSLSLVTLAGIPIFSSIIAFLSTRMKSSITAQQAELTHASKISSNAIASMDSVKCLNGQAFESRSYSSRIEQSAIHYLRQARLNSLQIAIIRWMMFAMFVQGFWYGSSLARNGKLTSGEVMRTFWACLTAAQSIEQVLPQMIVMEKGKVASVILKSLIRTCSEQRDISEAKDTLYPRHCEGGIEVNNVSITHHHRHYQYKNSHLHPGIICLSHSTRPSRPEAVHIFLSGRADDLCHWQKWLQQKHAQPATHAILHTNVRRDTYRWHSHADAESQLGPKQYHSSGAAKCPLQRLCVPEHRFWKPRSRKRYLGRCTRFSQACHARKYH